MTDDRNQPDLVEPLTNMDVPSPRRRIVKIVAVAVIVLITAFGLFAMFVPSPPVAEGVLTATSDDEEESGYRQEGEISDGSSMSATATSLKSQRNVSAMTAQTSSGGDRFFDRTIAIFNLNEDLLMKRLGLLLFEQLRDAGRFQQVRYLPAGKRLPDGERLPEIFVTLKKDTWTVSGLPGHRSFEGKLIVTAGDRFRRSSHGYHDHLTPPGLQFRWRARIDYTANQTGIETSGARYQAVSNDLAKEITGQLTKLFDGLSEKHGSAPDLPDDFYPDYTAPPEFDFLKDLDAEKLVDGSQFMKQSVAVWRVPATHTREEVLKRVAESLKKEGWKIPEHEVNREHLRARNGNQVIEVFRQNDGTPLSDQKETEPTIVTYEAGMNASDLDDAVENLFEESSSEAALLMFQVVWYRHREQVERYFEQHPPTQAETWLRLAYLYEKSEPDRARQSLLRANALNRLFHSKSADSSMKKLAENLGIDKLPQAVSPETIESLAVENLLEPGEIRFTSHTDVPSAILLEDSDKQQSWLLLTPLHQLNVSPARTFRCQLVSFDTNGGMTRSTMTGGDLSRTDQPAHVQYIGDGNVIEISSEPRGQDGTYRLTLRRIDRE